MKIRSLAVVAVLAVPVATGACSSGDSDADTSAETTTSATTEVEVEVPDDAVATDQVAIAGRAFDPEVIVVEAGTTVAFTNADDVPHTVTSDEDGQFDTGQINAGDQLTLTFEEPGSFGYHCTIHPEMTGTVVVTP